MSRCLTGMHRDAGGQSNPVGSRSLGVVRPSRVRMQAMRPPTHAARVSVHWYRRCPARKRRLASGTLRGAAFSHPPRRPTEPGDRLPPWPFRRAGRYVGHRLTVRATGLLIYVIHFSLPVGHQSAGRPHALDCGLGARPRPLNRLRTPDNRLHAMFLGGCRRARQRCAGRSFGPEAWPWTTPSEGRARLPSQPRNGRGLSRPTSCLAPCFPILVSIALPLPDTCRANFVITVSSPWIMPMEENPCLG